MPQALMFPLASETLPPSQEAAVNMGSVLRSVSLQRCGSVLGWAWVLKERFYLFHPIRGWLPDLGPHPAFSCCLPPCRSGEAARPFSFLLPECRRGALSVWVALCVTSHCAPVRLEVCHGTYSSLGALPDCELPEGSGRAKLLFY